MADGSIKIDTKIDSSGLDKQLSSMKASMDKIGDVAEKMALSVSVPIIAAMGFAVKAFADAEKGDARLRASIEMTGGVVSDVMPQYEALANSIMEVTDIDDDAVKGMITFAKQLGVTDDAMSDTVKGAIGLSKITGNDLQSSMKMAAMAANGEFAMLERFSPEMRKAKTDTEKFAIAQKMMANGFKLAEAEGKTFGGSLSMLKNDLGNLGETFGKIIAEAVIPAVRSLRSMIATFQGMSGTTQKYLVILGAVLAALPLAVIGFGQLLKMVTSVREAMALLSVAQRAQMASMAGFAALAAGVFLAINYAMDKAAESYNKYVDKLDAENLPLSEANDAIKANKQEIKDMTHELVNQQQVLKNLENFRAQNKITQMSQDELDVKKNIVDIEAKITNAKQNQQKIMDRLNRAQFGGKKNSAPTIETTGLKGLTKGLTDFKTASDDAFNVSNNLDEYGAAIGIINNQVRDGAIEEEEGKQRIIDLTKQQIQSLYEQGAIIANVNDESASANDQVLRSLTENLAKMELTGAAAFMVGAGIPINIAKGLSSAMHYATEGVKTTVEMMAVAFDKTMAIFEGAFDILSWVSDFDPKAMFTDFETFINGIIDFFTNDLGSIPVFADMSLNLIKGLIQTITENLPAFLSTIGNVIDSLVKFFVDNAPTLIPQIVSMVVQIASVLLQKLPEIFNTIVEGLITFLESLGDSSSGLTKAFTDAIIGVIKSISDNLPALIAALVVIMVEVFKGIVGALPEIISALIGIIVPLTEALIDALPEIINALVAALPDIIIAIIKALPELLVALVKATVVILTGLVKYFYEIGKMIVVGIANGIKIAGSALWNGVKSVFTSFIDKVKGLFGIHSPSTVFFDFGVNIIKGMINGLMSMASTLLTTFTNIFNNILTLITNFFGSFSSIGSGMVSSIADGIVSAISFVADAINNIINSIRSALSNAFSMFKSMGASFGEGLISGLIGTASQIGKKLVEVLQGAVNSLIGNIKDFIMDWIVGKINDMTGGIVSRSWENVKDHWKSISIMGHKFHAFAKGSSNTPAGMALVGENGPELMEMPAHARVYTANETRAMMSVKNGLSGLGNLQSLAPMASSTGNQTIVLNNTMTGSAELDGRAIMSYVFKNIDKYTRAAYGN